MVAKAWRCVDTRWRANPIQYRAPHPDVRAYDVLWDVTAGIDPLQQ